MDKKTIILELPSEIINQIDKENNLGDRSVFISDLLNTQLKVEGKMIISSNELKESESLKNNEKSNSNADGKLTILNNHGDQIGVFNINNIQEFESLAKTIELISNNPKVKIRTQLWR
jgi:hypothetical protein